MKQEVRLILYGALCVIVPAALLYIHPVILQCVDGYRMLAPLLAPLDVFLRVMPLVAFFLIPSGICMLIGGYLLWQKSRGAGRLSLILQGVWSLILILLLGSIVLASLNTARSLGSPNTQVKSLMSNVRAVAEIHQDTNKSFVGLCSSSEVQKIKERIYKVNEHDGLLCAERIMNFSCIDGVDAFAVSGMLRHAEDEGVYYCVDSSGFRGIVKNPARGTTCQ